MAKCQLQLQPVTDDAAAAVAHLKCIYLNYELKSNKIACLQRNENETKRNERRIVCGSKKLSLPQRKTKTKAIKLRAGTDERVPPKKKIKPKKQIRKEKRKIYTNPKQSIVN